MREHVKAGEVVRLASELIAVDTSNPPGREAPLEEVLRAALEAHHPSWTRIEPEPGRVSLVAELPPGKPGEDRPRLLVNGHLDVVPVDRSGWSREPFEPCVDQGRLYGRGSADMKGGIAAAICALDVLGRAGRAPACDLVFHFVADEERGGRLGTQALLEAGLLEGDACLIPEPTDLALCIAERGLYQARITVHGRPGHGSRPREAVSAIEHAARLVLALHAADFGDPWHPLLGQPTANVGTIAGGTAFNTVAESCLLGLDRRLLPGVDAAQAEAGIRARISSARIEGLRYDLELDAYGEASEMPPDDPFAVLVGDAVAEATGTRPEAIGMSFTTDARFLRNQAGIPTVVCGPGAVEQAHCDDEHVTVQRLVEATATYARLYASFDAPFGKR